MMITSRKSLRENDRCQLIIESPELDESDEERELTNLNWLLRNQNVTWPKTIDGISGEDINATFSDSQIMESGHANVNLPKNQTKPNDCINPKTKKILTPNLVSYTESRKQGPTTTVAPSKRLSPAERYDIFINKIKRDLTEYEKYAIKYKTDVTEKPPFNYSHIIGMAMLENGRVTLQQICAWIESKFAFFRARKKWNNSIRHNLSLHHCFRNRKREEKGKGGYWELGVDPKKCDRKRIRNRKSGQSKLISNIQIAKNHCPLTKFQICEKTQSISNSIECSRENPIQFNNRQHSQHTQPNHNKGSDKVAQLELIENTCTLTEIEVDTGHSFPNVLSSPIQDPDNPFLSPNDLAITMSTNGAGLQQYELETIIISTTGIIDESSSLNSIINNKFSCTNMIYTEDEIPMSNENVIISSCMSTVLDVNNDSDMALVSPIVSSSELPSNFGNNCDYSNFRSYIDGVDESFNYLHSTEINRNEDILDNLLGVCVTDY